jgi:nucleoside-diphosphate-sugar epimerase
VKKILVTGANGYVGSSLVASLNGEITKLTRAEADITDPIQVDEFFKDKHFDVVIHCATAGGSRLSVDSAEVTHQNLQMFYNLVRNKKHYTKFINIGSGAEYDRTTKIAPIWNKNKFPTDPYGMSKHIINSMIQNMDDFYTIRIYAIFDENELDTRFIKSNIKRYINKKPMIIHKNKLMDFFYMKDFINVVEHYIESKSSPKEIDCTYEHTYSLSEISEMINCLDEYRVVCNPGVEWDAPYFGNARTLKLLNIPLQGLQTGITNTYKILQHG